jgi:hypothetical protein
LCHKECRRELEAGRRNARGAAALQRQWSGILALSLPPHEVGRNPMLAGMQNSAPLGTGISPPRGQKEGGITIESVIVPEPERLREERMVREERWIQPGGVLPHENGWDCDGDGTGCVNWGGCLLHGRVSGPAGGAAAAAGPPRNSGGRTPRSATLIKHRWRIAPRPPAANHLTPKAPPFSPACVRIMPATAGPPSLVRPFSHRKPATRRRWTRRCGWLHSRA